MWRTIAFVIGVSGAMLYLSYVFHKQPKLAFIGLVIAVAYLLLLGIQFLILRDWLLGVVLVAAALWALSGMLPRRDPKRKKAF